MTRAAPRVLSIPPGVPFLPELADALLSGRLVPGFSASDDPLALADVTIYVPTRRAARELRAIFAQRSPHASAILPLIRPLGEFDAEEAAFGEDSAETLSLAPPISALDRLLTLAPLVQAWKRRLPAHVAALYAEDVVVPASTSDAIWYARDLAALIDEMETEGADWKRLGDLVTGNLAGWWQVTLDFLAIVTAQWPDFLAERGLSDPAAHRSALVRLEAARLAREQPARPVIAAGSTGSIPATAELLSVIARLPGGAVVLPGLDRSLDARAWSVLTEPAPRPAVLGHPQYGLAKLLAKLGVVRDAVDDLAAPSPAMETRMRFVSAALRPAETTDDWAALRADFEEAALEEALAGVTLVEAPKEREEATVIALALANAVRAPGRTAALVTGDRELARRVSAELLRFGVRADDSGGTPLAATPPATLLSALVDAAFTPGDPVAILSLLKHPLLQLGLERGVVRHAAETIELVLLRGGTGRPDLAGLLAEFDQRLLALADDGRPPFWLARLSERRIGAARNVLSRLIVAVAPLLRLRGLDDVSLADAVRATVESLEALGRGADGALDRLYAGDAGERLADVLSGLVGAAASLSFAPSDWPDILAALVAPETVKPGQGGDPRIFIWGALEARLQDVDTLIVGGLNEGVWPRRAEADRFLSRLMKTGLELEPPERRIGQAAHDFVMAMGAREVILTRSARSGDAPAVTSRWLQRLLAFAGERQAAALRGRGRTLLAWAAKLDAADSVGFVPRPKPAPPLEVRPRKFSVTEIETLRRDPYAIYARRILDLFPLDPLVRDPGAAERGTLFHDILHRFSLSGIDPRAPEAEDALVTAGRDCFAEVALPDDIAAIWWPRFERMVPEILDWEQGRAESIARRHAEVRAGRTPIGATGVELSGYADRIDQLAGGMADILDYKTGSTPSKGQAHTLLSPQLALEGALLKRGAFAELGAREPADLAYVRLRANGKVDHESILEYKKQPRSASDLSDEAWRRLEALIAHYGKPEAGYLSRALPFREGDVDGDYDHLARVLEWSPGGDGPASGEGE